MYSTRILALLRKAGAEIGDSLRIASGSETYEGILMPRAEGGADSAVLKLKSGYNVGVPIGADVKIEVVKKAGKKQTTPATPSHAKKGALSVLGCGGTIASKVEYVTGAVFPSLTEEELLSSVPELKGMGDMSTRVLFNLLSEDMSPEHWKIIAREVEKDAKEGAGGIVLTHGTDTMHYTSAALSFMLRNLPVPVVLVGSQRSSDRGSSDNVVNLVCAASAAKGDVAEVSVCMHANTSDEICWLHRGTRVRKMHTSRRDAFRSINSQPLAKIHYKTKKVEMLTDNYNRRSSGAHLEVDDKLNPNVALVHTYPGIKPGVLSALAKHDGIVIAGTGLGHVPTNAMNDKHAQSLLPEIKNLVESGIPVVIAPQTIYGRVNLNVYTAGRLLKEAGVIGDGADWLPEVALVKLMWVLGHTKKMEKVREMMMENMAGELSARSPTEPDYFE